MNPPLASVNAPRDRGPSADSQRILRAGTALFGRRARLITDGRITLREYRVNHHRGGRGGIRPPARIGNVTNRTRFI